jgi:hypothetical protein
MHCVWPYTDSANRVEVSHGLIKKTADSYIIFCFSTQRHGFIFFLHRDAIENDES